MQKKKRKKINFINSNISFLFNLFSFKFEMKDIIKNTKFAA